MGAGNRPLRRRGQGVKAAASPLHGVGHLWGDDDMTGIVELVLAGHQRILLLQQALADAGRPGAQRDSARALAMVWGRLADMIDVQAAAEEEVCYLPMVAARSWSWQQMEDAVADLDEIREAVAEAQLETAGSRAWWRAVKAALSACAEHFDRQEEGVLADFARRADRRLCQQLGGQWSAFITARIRDLAPDDQAGGAACQLCQWPLPASHPHVLDSRGRAALCACHCCYLLHGWAARGGLSGACDSQALPGY